MNGRLEKEQKIDNIAYRILKGMPLFVSEWYEWLEANAKTASSRKDFLYKVKKYIETIDVPMSDIKIGDLTYQSVTLYMKSIRTKINTEGEEVATSGSYQKTIWAALNSFFKFLVKRNYIENNPMDSICVSRKSDKARIDRNRKFLTIKDFNKMIDATNSQKNMKERTRDKAILLIFMSTGIRRRALTQINLQDIDFNKGILNVIDKEDAERDCFLTPQALDAIKEYLEYRGNEEGPLFYSAKGNRISEEQIYSIVRKYSKLGLGYEISPHKLRAGFCTILYEKTKDLRYVQETVGHSSITTTQRYAVVEHDCGKKICEIFNRMHS